MSIILAIVFFVFKPLDIKEQSFNDVPLFEVSSFTIYEINTFGLDSILLGTKGTRYVDRYDIENVNFTDNTKKYIANIKANNGIYKNDIITLIEDVLYNREDGLSFSSDEAIYDKKSSIVQTHHKYIAYQGKNRLTGTSLVYNNLTNKIKSKNITIIYQLKEK